MEKELSVTYISVSGPGTVRVVRVPVSTSLSEFLDEYETMPMEHSLVLVNKLETGPNRILEDGDCVTVTPNRIRAEQRVKVNNRIWTIHAHDDDPFPSSPHAHNYEAGLKLDLRSGDVYERAKRVSRLSKKEMLRIKSGVKGLKLP